MPLHLDGVRTLVGPQVIGGMTFTGDLPTTHGLSMTMNAPMATLGNIHVSGIHADITQTSAVSGSGTAEGRLYGIRSIVRQEMDITNVFGVHGMVVATPAASSNVNDFVGVYGGIDARGTFVRSNSTLSSWAALKGDIWNTCTGAWNAQVYCLMLGYGSSVDYGGETAFIHAYSHADTYLDYGIHLISNSTVQAMTAGIYIDSNTSSTITKGIDIDGSGTITTGINIGACTTAAVNIATGQTLAINIAGTTVDGILKAGVSDGSLIQLGSPATATSWVGIGIFGTLTGAMGRNAGGGYPEDHGINIVLKEDGEVQFMYAVQARAYASSGGVAQEMFGLYGRARVESGGTVGYGSNGQAIGVYGLCYLKSGGTLDVGGSGVLAGGRFSYKDQGATHSTSGVKTALFAEVEEGTPDSIIHLLAHAGAGTIPAAISINNAANDCTNLFKFIQATGFIDTAGHGAGAAGRIKVDVAGSTRYLYLYSN